MTEGHECDVWRPGQERLQELGGISRGESSEGVVPVIYINERGNFEANNNHLRREYVLRLRFCDRIIHRGGSTKSSYGMVEGEDHTVSQ